MVLVRTAGELDFAGDHIGGGQLSVGNVVEGVATVPEIAGGGADGLGIEPIHGVDGELGQHFATGLHPVILDGPVDEDVIIGFAGLKDADWQRAA